MAIPDEKETVVYWRGRPITELTREELIDAVCLLGAQVCEFLSAENTRARALGYLMMKRP